MLTQTDSKVNTWKKRFRLYTSWFPKHFQTFSHLYEAPLPVGGRSRRRCPRGWRWGRRWPANWCRRSRGRSWCWVGWEARAAVVHQHLGSSRAQWYQWNCWPEKDNLKSTEGECRFPFLTTSLLYWLAFSQCFGSGSGRIRIIWPDPKHCLLLLFSATDKPFCPSPPHKLNFYRWSVSLLLLLFSATD